MPTTIIGVDLASTTGLARLQDGKLVAVTAHGTVKAAEWTDVVSIALTKGRSVVVDAVDADLATCDWYAANCGSNSLYARNDTMGLLHRVIADRMNLDMSRFIDHKNRDTLDCRRQNLRAATRSQNQANTGLRASNKSGYIGIYFNGERRPATPWRAKVQVTTTQGKRVWSQNFGTLAEAIEARAVKAREFHGEFAVVEGSQ